MPHSQDGRYHPSEGKEELRVGAGQQVHLREGAHGRPHHPQKYINIPFRPHPAYHQQAEEVCLNTRPTQLGGLSVTRE